MTDEEECVDFTAAVKSYTINSDGGSKRTIYTIACNLSIPTKKKNNPKVYQWTVDKRYNDLQDFNSKLGALCPYDIEKIRFPGSHIFVWDKFAESFIKDRW